MLYMHHSCRTDVRRLPDVADIEHSPTTAQRINHVLGCTDSTCTSTPPIRVCVAIAPHWIPQTDVPAALSLFGFVLITIPLLWHLRGE